MPAGWSATGMVSPVVWPGGMTEIVLSTKLAVYRVPAVGVPAGATASWLGRVPARIELTVNVPGVIAVTSAPAACPT